MREDQVKGAGYGVVAWGTEGERSEPGVPQASGSSARPDPEVRERPVRRRFTSAYKAGIVREAEACQDPGEVGALLRREGLYSSYLSAWRKQMREGALSGLENRRGRKKEPDTALRRRLEQPEKENARLKEELRRAETVIEVQKKTLRDAGNGSGEWRERLSVAAGELAERVGVKAACGGLGVARSTLYRRRKPKRVAAAGPRSTPEQALKPEERRVVL